MKVAIIGAGIAGLTLARALALRGVNVSVFEKSQGLGGRLSTKRLPWGNIDIGAQYFTARDKRFQEQVSQWQTEKVVSQWCFQPHTLSPQGLMATDDTTRRYVGTPNMNSLAHALAGDLANTTAVASNTRITSIQRCDERWTLVNADNQLVEGHYDWVVSSLPAEQSRVLLTGTAIAQNIPHDMHQPCWALALATRGDIPQDIQGIFGDDTVTWASRLTARPGRQILGQYDDLWMLHFSSRWSSTHPKDTAVNLTQTGLDWLTNVLNTPASGPLKVVHDYKHYWRYARVPDDQQTTFSNGDSFIADKATGIASIGAWSAGGRVEGAYLSALDFADYLFT